MLTEQVFQDEVVRATDLNHGSGEVLNRAFRSPVTIIRNDESFALMRREVAAHWRKEASYGIDLTELVWHALSRPAVIPPEFHWVTGFSHEQALEMTNELMHAYRKAVRDGHWEQFDAIVHEWAESGWAALNSDLREAFDTPSDEVEIEEPC